MSSRGVAWTVSPYLVAAVMVRGRMRCVWCGVEMRANRGGRYKWRTEGCAGHTVDHYVPARQLPPSMAHAADNLLPACIGCNDSRRHGRASLAARLGGAGPLRNAERRAARQLARPVDRRAPAVRALAEAWYGGRLAWLRDWQRRKRARRARAVRVEPRRAAPQREAA
jgi:hypothetical protein